MARHVGLMGTHGNVVNGTGLGTDAAFPSMSLPVVADESGHSAQMRQADFVLGLVGDRVSTNANNEKRTRCFFCKPNRFLFL